MNDETTNDQPSEAGRDWLGIARDAFSASTSYMDANWRKGWERNHRDYSGTEIARFIVDLTVGDEAWRRVPWAAHVFTR